MQTLIQDLLQVSRVETGAKPLEPTDAGEVVAGVVRGMETPLREAGATVEVDDLPAVLADAAQLEQVFVNLVGNAIKYRRPDVPLAIRIAARRTGPMVEFSVRDNGIGIEAEYFDRIFEMFRRLHTHDEYEGTGIGLAVVKRIVDRHGGTIRVESSPGAGGTFLFTLRPVDRFPGGRGQERHGIPGPAISRRPDRLDGAHSVDSLSGGEYGEERAVPLLFTVRAAPRVIDDILGISRRSLCNGPVSEIRNFAGEGRPVLLGIARSQRLEFVEAPAHAADLARYRARGHAMAGNRIRLVTDRPMETVEVHSSSANSR